MPRYKVLAKDPAGNRVQQVIEAVNQAEAASCFRGKNLTVVSIVEDTSAPSPKRAAAGGGGIEYKLIGGPPKPRIKSKDLVIFTRQMSTMISSGIQVLEALDILTEQATDPGFKLVLTRVVEDVRAGVDLSGALQKHPRVFTDIYVNMIRAAEAAGKIDEILNRLAEYMEASEKLRQQIFSAMTYPVVSIFLVLGIAMALLIGVVPQFETMFEQLLQGKNAKLPLPTRITLSISRALVANWLYALGGIIAFIVVLRWWKKTKNGAYAWDRMMLGLPVFGPLIQKIALSRFARTFATLISSGVNILPAMDIVAATSGNKVVERAVLASRDSIRAGEPLAKPLSESPVFPPMVVRMVATGEKSGKLELLLTKISQFYDEQVSATVEGLTSLIEPIMIGIMGLLVGGIVLSVFLPILEIQGKIGKKG
jgi:type IV pilus assembly protein PilC